MVERVSSLRVSVGFFSATGPRKDNEDFAGAVIGSELPNPRSEVVAAIGDTKIADYYRRDFEQKVYDAFKRRSVVPTARSPSPTF